MVAFPNPTAPLFILRFNQMLPAVQFGGLALQFLYEAQARLLLNILDRHAMSGQQSCPHHDGHLFGTKSKRDLLLGWKGA